MKPITLKGRKIVEGYCRAEALASKKPISFLGGVDPTDGKIIEKNHDLHGQCIKDMALCFPHGHGSTVGSYVLYALAKKNLAPKAIVNQIVDPVVAVGAIIANIPMIDKVNIAEINTGDLLEVNATEGFVKIIRRRSKSKCI